MSSADVSNLYGGGGDDHDGWRPVAPPVTAGDLAACEFLVLHYWAIWDRHDREMDRLLAPLREEFAGRICFRSCDTDRSENRPFINDLATVPALGLFVRGKRTALIIGRRSSDELRVTFQRLLGTPIAGAGDAGGVRRRLSEFLMRWLTRRPRG